MHNGERIFFKLRFIFLHFQYFDIAKNTINYGKHYYQVDLMTPGYYDHSYKQGEGSAFKIKLSGGDTIRASRRFDRPD